MGERRAKAGHMYSETNTYVGTKYEWYSTDARAQGDRRARAGGGKLSVMHDRRVKKMKGWVANGRADERR